MSDHKSLLENKPDYLVCTCMGVMYSEIVQCIQAGSHDFESISNQLLVGTGCNSCVAEIIEILKEALRT